MIDRAELERRARDLNGHEHASCGRFGARLCITCQATHDALERVRRETAESAAKWMEDRWPKHKSWARANKEFERAAKAFRAEFNLEVK